MAEKPKFRIKRWDRDDLWLATDIDSGGMTIHWTKKKFADTWETYEACESFASRVSHRYPSEPLDIIND